MKIALAQLNPIVGDLRGNRAQIEQAAERARTAGANLLVTPELCISGYPPKDLLLRDGFVAACERVVASLGRLTSDEFGILVGHPAFHSSNSGRISNAATLLAGGGLQATVEKTLLPNYDVFDEMRYFQPAFSIRPIEFQGVRLGVHICEDAWWGEPDTFYHIPPAQLPNPIAVLAQQGVDLFINLSASPYEFGKMTRRHQIIRRHIAAHSRPFLLVNQVGGNDDLIFDGNSFLIDGEGQLRGDWAGFETDFAVFEVDQLPGPVPEPEVQREVQLLRALTLGLQDYIRKCGFTDCVLGLSGGIDSALAACIAARALGPEHVHGILLPSRYSSQHSLDDARQLAAALGMDWRVIPFDNVHQAYETLPYVGEQLHSAPGGLADQNLQARIRGAIVMQHSNHNGWIALATGNKSELAVGYCTLYGDMCGGFAVLSDLYKRDVYAISRLINDEAGREIIPENILTKAPSAELAPNQFDEDSLPPYPVLDAILHGLIDEERSPGDLAREYPKETVLWVVRQLDRNEFKRRQMPPGIKLSARSFGSGRRMPMAARGFDAAED